MATSHYRVCTMLRRRYKLKPRDKKYVVRSLKETLLYYISAQNDLDTSLLPTDLSIPLKSFPHTHGPFSFCPTLHTPSADHKVGNFGHYDKVLEEVMPKLFRVDLLQSARSVLQFMAENNEKWFGGTTKNEEDNKQEIIRKLSYISHFRYSQFLNLQNQHLDLVLIPPVDVQIVWFSDMLQSFEYHKVCTTHYSEELSKIHHPS